MNDHVRWGILGAGKIAHKFASDLSLVAGAKLTAIGSLDLGRGKAFAEKFNVSVVYDSYEKLATSPEVDVIYIATPHGFHYEHVMLCLRNGKPVLCEKAFALNSKHLREMIAMARKNQVFLMEAFWTKFIPQYQKVVEMISSKMIGDIRLIHADFGFKAPTPIPERLINPRLGGGSLLDIGIYPVFLAVSLLGRPVEVKASMVPYETGVDEQCTILLSFENRAEAVLYSTLSTDTPTEAMIAGTEGRIQMKNRFHNPVGHIELVKSRDEIINVDVVREEGYGYQFEARHVVDCLRKGLVESPVMRLDDSLLLMETLDRIRESAGIRYDVD